MLSMMADALHIYRHVFFHHMGRVGLILVMSLLSQIALLVSLILPWQILQVLATSHSRLDILYPNPLPPITQLIWLSVIITFSFGLYLGLKKYAQDQSDKLAMQRIRALDKTKLMVNHKQVATVAMNTMVKSLSTVLNFIVFSGIGLIVYPKLQIAVLGYVVILGIAIANIHQRDKATKTYTGLVIKPKKTSSPNLQQRLQQNLLILMNIGIAVAFTVIVYDYLHQNLPPLFLIFIAILVVRQALIAFVHIFIHLLSFNKQRKKINLLFLPYDRQLTVENISSFEQYFYQKQLMQWLPNWVQNKCQNQDGIGRLFTANDSDMEQSDHETSLISPQQRCANLANSNIVVTCEACEMMNGATIAYVVVKVSVALQGGRETKNRWLLLKCYHPTKQSIAQHEIDFLSTVNTSLEGDKRIQNSILPTLIESGEMDWTTYLLFDFSSQAQWLNSVERKIYYPNIRNQLYAITPPAVLMQKFAKTYADLPTRMRGIDWQRLNYLPQKQRQQLKIDELIEIWQSLIARIERLPKTLVLDDLATPRMTLQEEKDIINRVVLYCWQGWVYDNMGAHWALSANIQNEVKAVVASLKQQPHKKVIAYIHQYSEEALVTDVVLAAKLHEMCRRLSAKNDKGAMNMLPGIFKTLKD